MLLLVAPVVLGLTAKALRGRLIPWWYAAVLYLAAIPSVVTTIQAGNHISPEVQSRIKGGIRIGMILLGRPTDELDNPPSTRPVSPPDHP